VARSAEAGVEGASKTPKPLLTPARNSQTWGVAERPSARWRPEVVVTQRRSPGWGSEARATVARLVAGVTAPVATRPDCAPVTKSVEALTEPGRTPPVRESVK